MEDSQQGNIYRAMCGLPLQRTSLVHELTPHPGQLQVADEIRAHERAPGVEDERMFVLEAVLHLSDLSNPARPRALSVAWAERIMEEFFAQGEDEKRLGLFIGHHQGFDHGMLGDTEGRCGVGSAGPLFVGVEVGRVGDAFA